MGGVIYVPIVKAKRHDMASLGDVLPSSRPAIRPLLELAEYASTDNDAVLRGLLKRLSQFQWPHPPYMDLYSFLPHARVSSGANATIEGFRQIAAHGLRVIPTYGFQRNDTLWRDLGQIAKRLRAGFCFRVDIDDLDDQAEQTWSEIIERAADMGISAAEVDLIVDLRYIGNVDLRRLVDLSTEFLDLRPVRFKPRLVALAGSSALKTVTNVPRNGEGAVVRVELRLWSHIQARLGALQPMAFGDYGVVHPDFSQSAPSPNANAKIRYTRGDSIHYFRGSRLFKPSNFGQYHELALRVVKSPQYRGRDYSVGDGEIWECANRDTQPGNLGTWVRIDQNHHIETTVAQIKSAVNALARGGAANNLLDVLQAA